MVPLPKAPRWVVEAGVDYANDELDEDSDIDIEERGGDIIAMWRKAEPSDSEKVTVKHKETEGSPKAFKKELERRND